MSNNVPPLEGASRICFGVHNPIEYNVKVKELGYVPEVHIHLLLHYWSQEAGKERGKTNKNSAGDADSNATDAEAESNSTDDEDESNATEYEDDA